MKLSILLPSGIGDIYWVMCVLEDFLKANGQEVPDIHILSAPRKRDRAIDYVKMLPFVNAVDYYKGDAWTDSVWKKVIEKGIIQRVGEFDYLICLNGFLERGQQLEDVGYKVNHYPPMIFDQTDLDYGINFRKQVGPYIVAFITDHGMYQKWLQELSPDRIYLIFKKIYEQTGCRIVMTGASWDDNLVNNYLISLDDGCNILVNLIGKTELGEFFGLLKASDGCFGFCAGNTMMSAVFRKPTVMIWNTFFKEAFWRNACPPDGLNKWYMPLSSKQDTKSIVDAFMHCRSEV